MVFPKKTLVNMIPLNLSSFVFFVLGVIYMDFRVDQTILGNKAITDDKILGYAFTHYQISNDVDKLYSFIFPIIMIILIIGIFKRIKQTRKQIDFIICLILLFIGVLFGILLVPTYNKMNNEFKKSIINDSFEYVYSSQNKINKIHKQLFFIANIHIIIFILCIILLFLLNESYKNEQKHKIKME